MTTGNQKIQQAIATLKKIPSEAYLLAGLNIAALSAFVCHDLPLHYVALLVCFAVCLVTGVAQAVGCWSGPAVLVTAEVQERVKGVWGKFGNCVAELLENKSVFILILGSIYLFSLFSSTLQILLIMNAVYCLVFFPKQCECLMQCSKESTKKILSKIQYHKKE